MDDSPINRLILKEYAKKLGIKTEEACNGLEALEKVSIQS